MQHLSLRIHAKAFDQLSVHELHAIYKLRSQVFVVEQNCVYADVDDWDKQAIHVWIADESGAENAAAEAAPGTPVLLAYCRVLPAGTQFDQVGLGRVIAVLRRQGLGTKVVQAGIRVARERFGATRIVLEAQVYAMGLYANLGFVPVDDEFLEDGIPHIKMVLDLA